MDENLCVSCGAEIPEGQQVCPACLQKAVANREYYGEARKDGKVIATTQGTIAAVAAWADLTLSEDGARTVDIRRLV